MRMKVNSNKGIYPDFNRNFLHGCRYDHDELPMGYSSMNLPPFQIQDLPCLSLVLIRLKFIIGLFEISADGRDFPKWLDFLTYDGFNSRVNVTEGLESFGEERIRVGKEEAGTSAFNQAYDKLQANQDKAQTR